MAPHTLTLFKTNIADFPSLVKTEFRFDTLFRYQNSFLFNPLAIKKLFTARSTE